MNVYVAENQTYDIAANASVYKPKWLSYLQQRILDGAAKSGL